jgi:hypothetical protein
MSKFMVVVAALLLGVAHVGAPLATAGEAKRSSGDIPPRLLPSIMKSFWGTICTSSAT